MTMNLKVLYLKYKKQKKPKKIPRIYLGNPNTYLHVNDDLKLRLKDVLIFQDMVGVGTSDGWVVDLRRILFDVSKRVFDEKYPLSNLPDLIAILTSCYIIEEVSHHLGEHHQNDYEDWCDFLLVYS